jgi:hypothetical protein
MVQSQFSYSIRPAARAGFMRNVVNAHPWLCCFGAMMLIIAIIFFFVQQ